MPVSKAKDENTKRVVVIEPPRFERAVIRIQGSAPYVQHKFSQKARLQIEAQQEAGSQAKKGRKREPKDFDAVCNDATYVSRDGWRGIPAPAFRNAMISACRVVGFKMTLAKLSLFIEADGFDRDDGTPLVKIEGDSRPHHAPARNTNGGVDIRARPMWEQWAANVRVRWDSDQFSAEDVVNLMSRVGMQVGIGEGRPDSKNSAGLGWGLFEVVS